jgi:hypothetical protein
MEGYENNLSTRVVRNPSQLFRRFWDRFIYLTKSVRNLWESTQLEQCAKHSDNFGTDFGRKLRWLKSVPNLSEKIGRKLIRPKIPSENTVFLVVLYL